MDKVRTRKETNKIFMDFRFQNQCFREQTMQDDTVKNHERLDAFVEKMEASIPLSQHHYKEYFPGSTIISKVKPANIISSFAAEHSQDSQPVGSSPLFREFAEQWLTEVQIEWRSSHIRNMRSMLNGSVFPYIGDKHISKITKANLLDYQIEQSKRPGSNGNTGETEYTNANGSKREIPKIGPVYKALVDQHKNTGKIRRFVFCNQEGKPLDQNDVTKRVWYPFLHFIPNVTRMDGSAFESLVRKQYEPVDNKTDDEYSK